MGDIKKIRKKYSTPEHPWRISRIQEENKICKEYGIPRKTELWKINSKLESFKNQAKSITTVNKGQTEQGNRRQKELLIKRLKKYNLVKEETLDAILSLTLKDILDRRLQTFVFKKGLAKTINQARQMIVHKHILVNNKIITSPSYLVKVSEEDKIEVNPKSPFYSTDHPERIKEPSKRRNKK